MVLVSIIMPIMNQEIRNLWFSLPNLFLLLPMPLLSLALFVVVWRDLHTEREKRPFLLSIGIFLMNYIGLGISLWPWLVPFAIDFRQAAAAPPSQSLLLVGTVLLLPLVLAYTGYCFYVFRGKASHEAAY
jgi:cytochrome d ubiquinol oxidase subunit II